MGLVFDILTLPVLGAPRIVHWLAKTAAQEAQRQSMDEGHVRGELLELQQQFDAGEVGEEDYDLQEKALLERLGAIREFKTRHRLPV